MRNKSIGERWQEDTMVLVHSTTKGLAAMTLAVAHSRGWLDYEERVCKYWPEFAQHELLRRVEPRHRSLGQFFQDEIASPLGLDFYIRLPESIPDSRLATLAKPSPIAMLLGFPIRMTLAAFNRRSNIVHALSGSELPHDEQHIYARNFEVPAGGGVGTRAPSPTPTAAGHRCGRVTMIKAGLCAALVIACVSIAPSIPAQAPAEDEAAIRTLEDQERAAVMQGDRAALERLWSERLTVNTPGNEVNAGRETVLAIVQGGDLEFAEFERTIEAVRIEGDVAIVMGAERMRTVGDNAATIHRRFTNIWKKEGSVWRMIARHANDIAAPE